MESTNSWTNQLLPKIFFYGEFMGNITTLNNRGATYFEAKRFADNDWLPEDFMDLVSLPI